MEFFSALQRKRLYQAEHSTGLCAFGKNVGDPASLMSALREGLDQIRQGTPAIIAIREPKLST